MTTEMAEVVVDRSTEMREEAIAVAKPEVVTVKTLDEIETIRPAWEQMQSQEPKPVPDADINRYISVVKSLGNDVQPHVILVKRGRKPVAMVIGRVEQRRLDFKVGYKTLLSPKLRCLAVVYGGVLGEPNGESSSFLVGEIMKSLESKEADVIYFNHLRTDTAFYQAIRCTPGLLARSYLTKIDKHWRMSVPEQMGEFYAGRSHKHRSNLRRAIRKFENDYSNGKGIVEYMGESNVTDFLKITADISVKTYQSKLDAGIVNDERTRYLLKAATIQGWFRGHILFADDVPCAFQLGLAYRDVYYLVNIGYDPDFDSYLPGTVLFLKVLKSLCDDPWIHTLDFYFGDAWYKQRYGTEQWEEGCPYVFAARLYPRCLNVLWSLSMGMNVGLERLISSIGSVNWIKRCWRGSMQKKG